MSAAPTDRPTLVSRLPRNALILFGSNAGGAVLLFILSALMGRVLGSEGLGIYAAALAWVFPLGLLVEFGLGTLITRDLAQDFRQTDAYLHTVTLARLIMGGVVLVALIVLAPLISADPLVRTGLYIAAPLVIIQPMFSSFTAVYKARGQMSPVAWLNVGMLIAQAILTVAVFALGGGVIAALVVNTVTSAGQLVAAWLIYHRHFTVPVGASLKPAPNLQALLRQAYPFALAAVFVALQSRLSLIFLQQMRTPAEVGTFSAAARFTEAARLIPNAFYGALLPALAALALDRAALARTFRRSMIGLTAFGIAAALGLTVLALPLLTLVYGDDFAPAAPILIALGWSLVFSFPRGGRTLYLYAVGREQWVNFVNGSVVVLQVALCLWLIPLAGAFGAALTQIAVEAAALALLWIGGRRP